MVALLPRDVMYGNPPSAGDHPNMDGLLRWMQFVEARLDSSGYSYITEDLPGLEVKEAVALGQFGLVLNDGEDAGIYEFTDSGWVRNVQVPPIILESEFADQAADSAAAADGYRAVAAAASVSAESYKTRAELAALAVGAKFYATESDGLASTPVGDAFIVQSGSVTQVFRAVADAAVLLGTLFDKADLLQSANNLSDIVDKTAALTALGAASLADVNGKLALGGGTMTGVLTIDSPLGRIVMTKTDGASGPIVTRLRTDNEDGALRIDVDQSSHGTDPSLLVNIQNAVAAKIDPAGVGPSHDLSLLRRVDGDARYQNLSAKGLLKVLAYASIEDGGSAFSVGMQGGFSSVSRTGTGNYSFVFEAARAVAINYIVVAQYMGGTVSRTPSVNSRSTTGFDVHTRVISSGGSTNGSFQLVVYEVAP